MPNFSQMPSSLHLHQISQSQQQQQQQPQQHQQSSYLTQPQPQQQPQQQFQHQPVIQQPQLVPQQQHMQQQPQQPQQPQSSLPPTQNQPQQQQPHPQPPQPQQEYYPPYAYHYQQLPQIINPESQQSYGTLPGVLSNQKSLPQQIHPPPPHLSPQYQQQYTGSNADKSQTGGYPYHLMNPPQYPSVQYFDQTSHLSHLQAYQQSKNKHIQVSQLPSPQQPSNIINQNLQISQLNGKLPPQQQQPHQQQFIPQQYFLPSNLASTNNMLPSYYNFQSSFPQPIKRLSDPQNIHHTSNETLNSKTNSISINGDEKHEIIASINDNNDNYKNRKNSANLDGYKIEKRRESTISSTNKSIRNHSTTILNDLKNDSNSSRPKCFLKFPSYPIHPAQIFQSLLQTDPIIENFKELDDFFSHKLNMKGYLNDMRNREKDLKFSKSNIKEDPNYEIEEFYKFTKHLSIVELEKLYLTFHSLANSFLHWIKIKDPNYQVKPIEDYQNLVFQPYANNMLPTNPTQFTTFSSNFPSAYVNPMINNNNNTNPTTATSNSTNNTTSQLNNDESIIKVVPFKPNHKYNSIVEFNSHGTLQPDLSIQKKIVCQHCGSTSTPEWRKGPEDAKTLCNACGLFHTKLVKKIGAVEAAAELRRRREIGEYNNRRI